MMSCLNIGMTEIVYRLRDLMCLDELLWTVLLTRDIEIWISQDIPDLSQQLCLPVSATWKSSVSVISYYQLLSALLCLLIYTAVCLSRAKRPPTCRPNEYSHSFSSVCYPRLEFIHKLMFLHLLEMLTVWTSFSDLILQKLLVKLKSLN